jgi:DNA-binding beta-propeller fold protein YncE
MPGSPEGLAVDEPGGILAVGLHSPDGVAVDEATGRVFVAGTDDDRLQLIDPGRPR